MYMNISNDKANTSLLFQIQVIKISILKCRYEKICKVAISLIFFMSIRKIHKVITSLISGKMFFVFLGDSFLPKSPIDKYRGLLLQVLIIYVYK